MDDWIRPAQAAAMIGVSVETMRRYGDAGRVRMRVLPSGHRRIYRPDVESLLVTTTLPGSAGSLPRQAS